MTVGRLTAALVLCLGSSAAGAIAEDREETQPIAVPVAPEMRVVEVSTEDAEHQGDASASEEEYLPLDLPAQEGEVDSEEEEPAAEDEPVLETAILGLEDGPSSPSFFVHAEILGVPASNGMVSASLCTKRNFTKTGCRTERIPAREGQVSVSFAGVKPGIYAVQVHYDQNGNGKMDFTFFGLPKEPYGFSRDAKPMLAPPKFEAACFQVTDGDISLVINLQNT